MLPLNKRILRWPPYRGNGTLQRIYELIGGVFALQLFLTAKVLVDYQVLKAEDF